jgi:YfiH family protein
VTHALLEAQVGDASVWSSGRAHGNVGDRVGDDPDVVARHRRALAAEAGLPDPAEWVWIRQVHGTGVYVADGPTPATGPPEADAAVTAVRGLPLAVVTADCAPLVLANRGAVAVVHAGHRGLAAGVVEAAIARLRAAGHGAVGAYLAPCIRPSAYEFGADDLRALVDRFGPGVAVQTRAGKPAFDVPGAIRVVLAREGITDFEDSGLCTADTPAYFSYRRDGATGRQATVAVLQ